MATSVMKKLACMVMLCMVFRALTNPHAAKADAVTCGGVTKALGPCIPYLRGTAGTAPAANCCNGVKSLKGMARTPADRRAACNCMKASAGKIKGLNYQNAARLPNQCGVSIAYTFSPTTNCNTVQ